MSESKRGDKSDTPNPHGCRHPSWERSEQKPGKVACALCGATGDELRFIKLDDPALDLRDTFTRMFVLAEYWQHEALKSREELAVIRSETSNVEALQAQIDRLMIEHCPDEMTEAQIENWKRHQKAVAE